MGKKNIHDGHRSRVKEEFKKMGLDHFPPHKVLEMLLYYAIPRGDTNEISHHLLARFGSIQGVLSAPAELLKQTPGIGDESATYLRMIGSILPLCVSDSTHTASTVKSAAQAKELMRHKFLSERSECVYLVCLGNNGKVIYSEKIFQGTGSKVDILPSKIVRTALLCSAVKAILAHNHPNGFCNPSREDLLTTNLLYEELRRVDIALMDHIIVAPDGVFSMAESNMLPNHST